MLVVDPEQRISIDEALKHPYLRELHDPEDEPVSDLLDSYDFDFDLYDLTAEQLKDLLYDEIMLYHDEEHLEKYLLDKQQNPCGSTKKKFKLKESQSLIMPQP